MSNKSITLVVQKLFAMNFCLFCVNLFAESIGSSNNKVDTPCSSASEGPEENLWQGQILGHFCEILGHFCDMLGYVLGNFMSFWVQY